MRKVVKDIFIFSVLLFFCALTSEAQRRPVIGISDMHKDGTNAAVPRSYVDAVLQSGGIPVVIPLMYDNEIVALLNSLDGVIFTGGEDFDPAYYNERPIPQMGTVNSIRDAFDIRTLRLAAERGLPILGICRGVQLINIVFGGSLYQDLPAQYYDKSIRHRQRQPKEDASHSVFVENNTVFADIVKERMLMVNSAHHQAIKRVADGFRVAGRSPDKIVEVIEKIDSENWILGVQFHPETRVSQDNAMSRIFRSFIEEASKTEKPFERVRLASKPRPQAGNDPVYTSPSTSAIPLSKEPPQPIKKTVADTQIVYKMVTDTQYIYVQADTVYKTIVEKQYVYQHADTVYKTIVEKQYVNEHADTVYKTIVDTQYIYNHPDTVYLSVADTKHVETRIDTFYIFLSDTVYINNPVLVESQELSRRSTLAKVNTEEERGDVAKIVRRDTMQTEMVFESFEEKDAKQLKKIQKQLDKDAKKEQQLKEKQAKKELKEKVLLAKKELAEQKEKEKLAKKEAEEKEKQFKQAQKENAKLDKKELKEAKTKELENTLE